MSYPNYNATAAADTQVNLPPIFHRHGLPGRREGIKFANDNE